MSRAALSVVAFAVYLFVIGPVLVLAPNLLLQLFGFDPTSEVWIRIVGGLACFLGYYYLMSGREENTGFMRWTTRGGSGRGVHPPRDADEERARGVHGIELAPGGREAAAP